MSRNGEVFVLSEATRWPYFNPGSTKQFFAHLLPLRVTSPHHINYSRGRGRDNCMGNVNIEVFQNICNNYCMAKIIGHFNPLTASVALPNYPSHAEAVNTWVK